MSEVVKLKPEDIDTERGLIYIKGAKGRKGVSVHSLRHKSSKATEIYTHVSNKDLKI